MQYDVRQAQRKSSFRAKSSMPSLDRAAMKLDSGSSTLDDVVQNFLEQPSTNQLDEAPHDFDPDSDDAAAFVGRYSNTVDFEASMRQFVPLSKR